MSEIRGKVQDIIRVFDNENSFIVLAAAAILPYLEQPVNRARFFNYDKKLELYFDSKDLNRFSRLKELTNIITERVKGSEVKGFERILKLFREYKIMIREKEGPSEGMAWQGFGGVHSHYSLTPLGVTLLIFQTSLRCSAVDFRGLNTPENWDAIIAEEMELITESLVNKTLRIRDTENHFSAKRGDTSYVTQRIFEFIAGAPRKITESEIRNFVYDKVGEIYIGEIPESIELLKPLLLKSGDGYILNDRGKNARVGYANLLVETALSLEDAELVHYMISSKNLEEGATNIIKHYALWF